MADVFDKVAAKAPLNESQQRGYYALINGRHQYAAASRVAAFTAAHGQSVTAPGPAACPTCGSK